MQQAVNYYSSPVAARTIGLIGLGEMGLPMASNLIDAGFEVIGCDLREERQEALRQAGGEPATLEELPGLVDILILSLPSAEAFTEMAERLLPDLRPGMIVIDSGTSYPTEARRLHDLYATKHALLIDMPVSGGPWGVEKKILKMFFGGPKVAFGYLQPVLESLGGKTGLFYCGESGKGQAMKGVNQLQMALELAPSLEILAFAQHSGIDLDLIRRIYPDAKITTVINRVQTDTGEDIGVKFRELPYYLKEAEQAGFSLPMVKALYEFCAKGEFISFDDHRKAPSFWHELKKPAGQA